MDPHYHQAGQYEYHGSVPSIQTPDTDVSAAFASMNIGNRGADPIQRSQSAMSARSMPPQHHPQHQRPPPHHASTLPPDQGQYYANYSAQPYDPNQQGAYEDSRNSSYSYDQYYQDGNSSIPNILSNIPSSTSIRTIHPSRQFRLNKQNLTSNFAGLYERQRPLSTTSSGKAVDLSTPPFTKEYIDQYRQRIKADPDPEAHFLYAKYLVDAAKKFRAAAKDPRVGKKYSEILITEALKVIRRLATQGDAYHEAQFFLANCYGTGALGLAVDHEKAYHLYLQAAKQNHAAAAYRVAVCNEIGAGTKREPPRAAAFYRKAASLGDTAAMYKLGMILLQGLLEEPKNPREAIGWLKRAAEQADEENPHALHELALLYEQGGLVPQDPVYAKTLYTHAAQLGYTPSQYKLGQCFEYGSLNCQVDPKRSIAWYTKAAEKGDAEAELALSGWYLTGSEGVLKQSDSEAYLWARRAANKGLSKAEYAVGYYAEDVEFAKRWYMRAAAQGNKRAMARLTEMKRMGNRRPAQMSARPTRQQAKDECVII
ncbi:enzyme activator [Ephemerocybe angulata]|uniref:Enzyme activator n=1 Tax=Ephemerocybe angulata TaxID=980116 RepID=A0A8H6HAK5_9AGAR|nr:enzyme activator [Tulosesus angulatus]